MLEQYFREAANGKRMLRPELHDKFFDDLHETLRKHVFDDADVLYDSVDNGTIEARLPEAEELIRHVRMRITEEGIAIVANFPATAFPEGEEKTYSFGMLYIPPDPSAQD